MCMWFAEEEEDELPMVTGKVVSERYEAVKSSAGDTYPLLIGINLKQDG